MTATRDILARLELGSDSRARRRAAAEIGADFAGGALSGQARAEAIAIFRTLLDDVEATVRAEMARALCRSADLPRDIALALTGDVLDIAAPILEWSDVLTENDLIDIIRCSLARADGEGHPQPIVVLRVHFTISRAREHDCRGNAFSGARMPRGGC